MIKFSKITAERPQYLAKRYTHTDGKLEKQTSANLQLGEVSIVELDAFADFADVLAALKPTQALIYGIPKDPEAKRVVTKNMLLAGGHQPKTIARTEDHFTMNDGPGIMMLDYDPPSGKPSLSRDELLEVLVSAVPQLADIQLIWWKSSSSNICKVGGEDLTGLRGQRIYVPVQDATDIPRAGKTLQAKLWLAGHGFIFVSASGSMLERTTFDASVWQPSRLDFAAGAVTCSALEQRRGAPILLNPKGSEYADTQALLPDLVDASVNRLTVMKTTEKEKEQPKASKVREAWLSTRRGEVVRSLDKTIPVESKETLIKAIDDQILGLDFVIFVQQTQSQKFLPVTVAKILEDPLKYHDCLTLDPVEPEYGDYRQVGKLYLSGSRPTLHSQAHGGQTWNLVTSERNITMRPEKRALGTKDLIEHLRNDSRFFDYGTMLGTIRNGEVVPLNEHSLELILADGYQFHAPMKDGHTKPIDPPPRVLQQVLSAKAIRGLKPLNGLLNTPTIREDGMLLAERGYDAASGLYIDYDIESFPEIVKDPSQEQLVAALDALWAPFRMFPYVDDNARGSMLAAIITSTIRPALPTAPMFHLDAPVIGSGKTLLMEALGVLATGRPVSVSAPPRTGDENEMRKLLTSSALPGNQGALLFDNCAGRLSSGALCAFLSSKMWSDRILGGNSLSGALPTRLFVAISGTNLTFSGDLNRRIIQCRIDPRLEVAFEREFDFCPVLMVKENRLQIIAATLTLILSAQQADMPKAAGRLASFDVWDRIVRKTVRYIAAEVRPGFYGDPVDGLRQRTVIDDDAADFRNLLVALHSVFESEWFLARDVADRINAETESGDLADAFGDVARTSATISSKSVGRHLQSIVDRILGGFVLRSRVKGSSKIWRIESICAEPASSTPKS